MVFFFLKHIYRIRKLLPLRNFGIFLTREGSLFPLKATSSPTFLPSPRWRQSTSHLYRSLCLEQVNRVVPEMPLCDGFLSFWMFSRLTHVEVILTVLHHCWRVLHYFHSYQPMSHDPSGEGDWTALSQGSLNRYHSYQIVTIWLKAVAKLQLWRGIENNFMIGVYCNVKGFINR